MIRVFGSPAQRRGEEGEIAAAEYLKKNGYTIIERNVANKYGEIDIIAKKSGIYHFFEVKTGLMGSWFNPAENMTPEKIRKLLISVRHYCLVRNIKHHTVQAVIVLLSHGRGESKIEILDLG